MRKNFKKLMKVKAEEKNKELEKPIYLLRS